MLEGTHFIVFTDHKPFNKGYRLVIQKSPQQSRYFESIATIFYIDT